LLSKKSFIFFLSPNPDKPELKIEYLWYSIYLICLCHKDTKALRKNSVWIILCVLVSWWQKYFAIKRKEIICCLLKKPDALVIATPALALRCMIACLPSKYNGLNIPFEQTD